jgi:hypothetical protein
MVAAMKAAKELEEGQRCVVLSYLTRSEIICKYNNSNKII